MQSPLNFPASGLEMNLALASLNHLGKHLSVAALAANEASALQKLMGALLACAAVMLSNPPVTFHRSFLTSIKSIRR